MTSVRTRFAVPADTEALGDILNASADHDPYYNYRFSNRKRFPEDFEFSMPMRCRQYIDENVVVVREVVDRDGSGSEPRVVAFAVYEGQGPRGSVLQAEIRREAAGRRASRSDTVGAVDAAHPPMRQRRDENPARSQAFKDASAKAKAHNFDDRLANAGGHFFLKLLLCHPEYWRRGHGTALVTWGIRRAATAELNTTLFASPMGRKLYHKLGFQKVAQVNVQVPGEKDGLTMPAMEYRYDNTDKSNEPLVMIKRRQASWPMVSGVKVAF